MMLKTGMKVEQYYSVFNYRPPISQNKVNFQDRKIVAGTGVNLETKFFLQGTVRRRLGRKLPICVFHE